MVVGIKALDVLNVLGKKSNTAYAYQEEQNGTGHAVQVALKSIKKFPDDGIVYVLPGDMGLIDAETLKNFRKSFIDSKADMIVLTGIFNGDPRANSYGRILRVKEFDSRGTRSLGDKGKVIEILEAIEAKYGITFSRHFFNRTEFKSLYAWCNNDVALLGAKNETKINFTSIPARVD